MEKQHKHLRPADQGAGGGRKQTKPQGKKKRKVIVVVLLVILAVILLALLAAYLLFQSFYKSMNVQQEPPAEVSQEWVQEVLPEVLPEEPEEIPEDAVIMTEEETQELEQELIANVEDNELFEDEDVYNILLLGNDTRGTGINERTDVMLLVSINTNTKQIVLTSFLRDIYLYIPGFFSQRLNAANVFGGSTLTVDTIEQNFGVSIDNYAQVNFVAFKDIVDLLGGVDIYLSAAEAQVVGCGYSEGDYHLDGEDALKYCRIRYLDSDFGRTERQRKVVSSLWTAMKDELSVATATSLMQTVLPQVTTDLSQADCLNLVLIATQIGNYELKTYHVPADGTYYLTMIDGMSVIRVNFEENKAIIHSNIYGE